MTPTERARRVVELWGPLPADVEAATVALIAIAIQDAVDEHTRTLREALDTIREGFNSRVFLRAELKPGWAAYQIPYVHALSAGLPDYEPLARAEPEPQA